MEDTDAIRECRRGDAEAFSHLVYRYQGRALAHARVLTGNEADAADAAQNAFLDAFRHLGRFDVSRAFYPWLYVLLRNRCIKGWARSTNRGGGSEITDRPGPATGPPEELYDLRAALDRLEPGDRELVVLKHMDGWTYDELAERLDIPRGTVMSRLFHARRRLKDLLEPERERR